MSRNNHFLFSYLGNKRREFNDIYDRFKIINEDGVIDKIYEPFCGSFAFSYFLSTIEPNKYEYHLNDGDSNLILLCQTAQDDVKFQNLIDELNDMTLILNKENYNLWLKDPSLKCYVFTSKCHGYRKGVYPLNKPPDFNKMKLCPVIKFLKTEKIIFTNNIITKIDDIYDKPEFFIFTDPPYLSQCDRLYKIENFNIYEYLYYNPISLLEAKIMLVLEDVWMVRIIFKDNIKKTYNKKYELSQKKTKHLIIDNHNDNTHKLQVILKNNHFNCITEINEDLLSK